MTTAPERKFLLRPAAGNTETWPFKESFAGTRIELQNEFVAPSFICWMPKGTHVIRPQGTDGPIVWRVHSGIAKVADRHLKMMLAASAAGKGPRPFLDLDHSGKAAGEPREFYWDPMRGVCLYANWFGAIEKAILDGWINKFSPDWTRHGDVFIGIKACVGSLLFRSSEPAFVKMPRIEPIQKRVAVELKAKYFLRRVDTRAREISEAAGGELVALRAFDEVKRELPELHGAFELLQALDAELERVRACV